MARSFRFVPPQPRSDLLTRPRLLRSLAGRWRHRVTALTGGPGLGKTTLLAQAIAENRLAPRGDDVWIGLEPHDTDPDRLSRAVAGAVTGQDSQGPSGRDDGLSLDPAAVADAVWRLAPTEACLVFDDVHVLSPGSGGAAWLGELVEALPANGHVVLASRAEPPVPLSRFGTQGAVLRLAEADLRFSADELTGFAERRGLDATHLSETGGWPAMAELAASVEGQFTGDYLWEEVLEPLGTMRRHVLAVLCDLGGADDDLATAAIGTTIGLADALAGVPLVHRDATGWYAPHGLWRTAPGLALDPRERAAIRRRAADHLTSRGRFDEAFTLLRDAEMWDSAPAVLRAACRSTDRVVSSQIGRWLAASPDTVRSSTGGELVAALLRAFTAPGSATDVLLDAAARCQRDGDAEGEMAALVQAGELAWYHDDTTTLGELRARYDRFVEAALPDALEAAGLHHIVIADLAGDDDAMLAVLGLVDVNDLDPRWRTSAGFIHGLVHLNKGDAAAAYDIASRVGATSDPTRRYITDMVENWALWVQGRIDEVLARVPQMTAANRQAGYRYHVYMNALFTGLYYATVGDVTNARRCVEELLASVPPARVGELSAHPCVVKAALQLAEGDEAAATATLREAVAGYGLDQGTYRHSWRRALALSYVLLPEARPYWDAQPLQGHLALARELAAAVVGLREGGGAPALRTLTLPDLDVVRANLPYGLAAELAVGLSSVGRAEGRALLDALGPPGREAVRRLVQDRPPLAKAGKALLAAVPAPPQRSTYLAVLGPLELRRDGPGGEEAVDPDLRRKRVQALVAYLVGHRRTTRTALAAALWPDLDDRAAANNLGVTLNHLLRVLEPWRDSGEPSFLLRLDGTAVQLVTGDHLRVDVDDFDRLVAAAGQAEADGTPSVGLDHYLAAADLYRDDLHLDVPEAGWFMLDRELYRTRFVTAAVRAGQLLLARGDSDRAQDVAHRALAVDQWSEGAYAILVGAAIHQGDTSAAHRLLQRCLDALADLGVNPTETTLQLQRRLTT